MSPSNSPLTDQEIWTRSDKYHNSFLLERDDALDTTLKTNNAEGLPDIAVTPAQGKFLMLLATSIGARHILEVGTLGGYSTIWLGKALPEGGKLVTLELDKKHAEVARKNIANAGLSSKIDVVIGKAIDSMTKLQPEPPFDLIFIDADKQSNASYFTEAKRLVRTGGVIIVDNVFQEGKVADPAYSGEIPTYLNQKIEGVRNLLRLIQGDNEVDTTAIGTVGEKGYDGFLYAVRK